LEYEAELKRGMEFRGRRRKYGGKAYLEGATFSWTIISLDGMLTS
jgi:hypothetical protein